MASISESQIEQKLLDKLISIGYEPVELKN